jgi:O-antigen/teichoic acid export membrane protein
LEALIVEELSKSLVHKLMSTLVTDEISAPIRIGQPIRAMLGQKRNRRVAASAGVGIFQRVVQVGATFVVMPLLLRVLGSAKFGVWGAAASLAWLSGLVDIGSGTALVTLVARSSAPERIEQARRHVAGALSIGTGLAGLFLLTAFIVSILVRTTFSPMIGGVGTRMGIGQNDAWPYLIAAVGLALNLPLNSGNNVWMALQKGYVSGWWELVQTLLTTAGLITAAMLTQDVRVYVAVVYLGLVSANLGSLVHLFLRHPELRPRGLWFSWPAMREVAGHGLLYFILALAGGLSFLLDNVLALGLLGPDASARMTIALRICVTAAGALWVISQPLWPAFAEAAEKADRKWMLKALLRGSGLLVGLTVAGSAVLVAFGERMLRWWLHTDLGIGSGLLWAISAWALSQALVRVPSLLLNGLSVVRYQVVVISIATALALALKFALAPNFGVAGILWATSAVVFLVVIPANVWRIWRWAMKPVLRVGEL